MEKNQTYLSTDKAGNNYWSNLWGNAKHEPIVTSYNDHSYGCHILSQFDKKFSSIVAKHDLKGKKVLEVGCAMSHWLPYFANEHNMQITGLDYSEIGCEKENELLKMYGIEGTIVFGDMFSPPEHLLEQFDLVYSMGVVEHFEDTKACIQALQKFLKPGGVIVTEIPYLKGFIGKVQKIVGREVYDIHVPLNKEDLSLAHSIDGLEVLESDYFTFFNANIWIIDKNYNFFIKFLFRIFAAALNRFLWLAETVLPNLPANSTSSAYVICVAKKTL